MRRRPCGRSPMAAIEGIALARLEPLLGDAVTVALVNTPTRVVVAGPPATSTRCARAWREAAGARRRSGATGGAAARRCASSGRRCRSTCRSIRRRWPRRWRASRLRPARAERWAPVLGAAADLARAQFVEPVRWDAVADEIRAPGADWVLDFGPGTAVARMTAENLRGSGVRDARAGLARGTAGADLAGRRARGARRHVRGVRARASIGGGTWTRATRAPRAGRR